VRAGQQVGGEALDVGRARAEEPPHVRVDEAAQATARPRALEPGRVGIAVAVGERVVTPMVGDPTDEPALDRQRTGDGEPGLERNVGLEAAVGEQPVEAHGDTEPGDDVERGGEDEVTGAHAVPPEAHDRGAEREQWADDHERGQGLLAEGDPLRRDRRRLPPFPPLLGWRRGGCRPGRPVDSDGHPLMVGAGAGRVVRGNAHPRATSGAVA
jgi:hypothetical protein